MKALAFYTVAFGGYAYGLTWNLAVGPWGWLSAWGIVGAVVTARAAIAAWERVGAGGVRP